MTRPRKKLKWLPKLTKILLVLLFFNSILLAFAEFRFEDLKHLLVSSVVNFAQVIQSSPSEPSPDPGSDPDPSPPPQPAPISGTSSGNGGGTRTQSRPSLSSPTVGRTLPDNDSTSAEAPQRVIPAETSELSEPPSALPDQEVPPVIVPLVPAPEPSPPNEELAQPSTVPNSLRTGAVGFLPAAEQVGRSQEIQNETLASPQVLLSAPLLEPEPEEPVSPFFQTQIVLISSVLLTSLLLIVGF